MAERILAHWPHEAGSVRFFRSSANFLYVFQSDDKRNFLRFADSSERGRVAIEAEVDLLSWLAAAGIAVPLVIPSRSGEFVTTTEMEVGRFHAVVFTELRGSQFDLDELDDRRFHEWGAALGRLHHALKGYPGRETANRSSWKDGLELVRGHIPPEARSIWKEWDQLARALDALPVDRGRFGLIHCDFELDNLVWDDHHVGILDFDDCAF